jgi:hypothetical protein
LGWSAAEGVSSVGFGGSFDGVEALAAQFGVAAQPVAHGSHFGRQQSDFRRGNSRGIVRHFFGRQQSPATPEVAVIPRTNPANTTIRLSLFMAFKSPLRVWNRNTFVGHHRSQMDEQSHFLRVGKNARSC